MVYLVYGWKPGAGPVCKVMKYDTDDYLTVPNDAFERFYFNSENQNISYMKSPGARFGFNNMNYPTSNQWNFYNFDGASNGVCLGYVGAFSTGIPNRQAWNCSFFIDRIFPGDFPPIFEAKIRRTDGRYLGPAFSINQQYQIGTQYRSVLARATSQQGPQRPLALSQANNVYADYGYFGWMGRVSNSTVLYPEKGSQDWTFGINPSVVSTAGDLYYTFWDLPADQSPIPKPSTTPVAGQEVIRLNSQGFIIARPGFTVDNSVGRQRIIDSTRNPPFCIMAAEIGFIPAGGSVFASAPAGVNLTDSMFVDIIAGIAGRDFVVPIFDRQLHETTEDVLITYAIQSNGVTFYNESSSVAIKMRYLVYCNDLSGASSGGVEVIRRIGNDIQIKKPGSSDTAPTFNDILLDTRFPSVQVLDEGYIPVDQFNEGPADAMYGEVAKTVPFNGSGMLIFPKIVGVFPDVLRQSYAALYRIPSGSGAYGISNQSVVSVLGSNSLKIHLSPTQATGITRGGSSWNYDYSFPAPLGARYYVLGVTPR